MEFDDYVAKELTHILNDGMGIYWETGEDEISEMIANSDNADHAGEILCSHGLDVLMYDYDCYDGYISIVEYFKQPEHFSIEMEAGYPEVIAEWIGLDAINKIISIRDAGGGGTWGKFMDVVGDAVIAQYLDVRDRILAALEEVKNVRIYDGRG